MRQRIKHRVILQFRDPRREEIESYDAIISAPDRDSALAQAGYALGHAQGQGAHIESVPFVREATEEDLSEDFERRRETIRLLLKAEQDAERTDQGEPFPEATELPE